MGLDAPAWLELLDELERSASSAPWATSHPDDEVYQGMIVVNVGDDLSHLNMRTDEWPADKIVAIMLIQEPSFASIYDKKFEENAQLVTSMRNNLRELIRLARRGLKSDNS